MQCMPIWLTCSGCLQKVIDFDKSAVACIASKHLDAQQAANMQYYPGSEQHAVWNAAPMTDNMHFCMYTEILT